MRKYILIISLIFLATTAMSMPLNESFALDDEAYNSVNDTINQPAFELNFNQNTSTQSERWSTYVENHNLFVAGLPEGTLIEVFSITGAKVAQINAYGRVTQINGLRGIYIVRANGQTIKTTVK